MPPEDFFVAPDELDAALLAPAARLEAPTLEVAGRAHGAVHRIELEDLGGLRAALERARATSADELMRPLADWLAAAHDRGTRVALCAGTASRADRLVAL